MRDASAKRGGENEIGTHTASQSRRGGHPRAILAAIEQQGRQTLELVRVIVGLLLPKEGGREGPTLEQLLATQREIITLGKATQADLGRLAETLPAAVAEAVENHAGYTRVSRA